MGNEAKKSKNKSKSSEKSRLALRQISPAVFNLVFVYFVAIVKISDDYF